MNEVEPILVIFEDRKEKEQVTVIMMLVMMVVVVIMVLINHSNHYPVIGGLLTSFINVWVLFGRKLDRSQSLFYFVPQESHSQAGLV